MLDTKMVTAAAELNVGTRTNSSPGWLAASVLDTEVVKVVAA